MEIEVIQTAIIMGFILSFMVGPVFFILLETAITRGFRAAFVFDIGVVFADIAFILIAYFSSYRLLDNLSNDPLLYLIGGLVLVVYGLFLMFRVQPEKEESYVFNKSKNYLGLFVKGFFLNFINVGVLMFWLGTVLVVVPGLNNDEVLIIYFFSFLVGAYVLVDAVKIILAKQLRSKLTPVRIVYVKRLLGILLVVSGFFLMYKGVFLRESPLIDSSLDLRL